MGRVEGFVRLSKETQGVFPHMGFSSEQVSIQNLEEVLKTMGFEGDFCFAGSRLSKLNE